MQHERSPTQDGTITLSSTNRAPFNFVVSITQPNTGASPARSFEITGPDPDLGSDKTCQYQLPDSGHNSYLDLYLNVARDFGTRLPLNRQPASEPDFKAQYHALLTQNLAPRMLYGYGDPAVLHVEDQGRAWYYILVTSNDAPDSFPIIRSRDLTTWEFVGFVFPEGNKPGWAADGKYVSDFWAPEMHIIGDKFKVYFAARDRETRVLSIGMAESSHPTGPFSPRKEPLLTGNTIDPHVFADTSGNTYLFWKNDNNDIWPSRLTQLLHKHPHLIAQLFPKREDQLTACLIQTLCPWIQVLQPIERFFAQQVLIEAVTSAFSPFRDHLRRLLTSNGTCAYTDEVRYVLSMMRTPVYAQRLAGDGSSLIGEPVKVIENDLAWEAHLIEGIWVVEHGLKYYLFYSGNDFSTRDYGIGVAIADSPLGPYRKMPVPLLGSTNEWSGPGHPSIAMAPDGELLLLFHAYFPGRTGYKEFRALLSARIQFEPDRVLLK
jgi:arabinan endo-1,5-alpha-L-arabinosidase